MEQLASPRACAPCILCRLICLTALSLVLPSAATAADRIVLRNLDVLTDRSVATFDDDGVLLDDNTRLGWDEIETARLATGQAEFEAMLAELGPPLARIRQRLRVGDYHDLLPHAESLYPRYRQRSGSTAYVVKQAVMWGRLAGGVREQALEPYLRCYAALRQNPDLAKQLPGTRRLQYDARTGLTDELLPVWFDAEAARQVLPDVHAAIAAMSRPRPEGAYVYYATLALAAEHPEQADRVLQSITAQQGLVAELRHVIAAQQELMTGTSGVALEKLERDWRSWNAASQALALYWLGQSARHSDQLDRQRDGLLFLLRIPPLFDEQFPELAAAALYSSMQTLARQEDLKGSVAVRSELLERYAQTWHAAQVRASESAAEEKP